MAGPMWIVNLCTTSTCYGPFESFEEAEKFAEFMTDEVDPALPVPLHSPVMELMAWRDGIHKTCMPNPIYERQTVDHH